MTRIPAEEKNNNAWAWILGLLLIGGAVWAIVALTGEEEPAPVAVEPAPVEPPAGPIVMDLATITTASNLADFFGRELQINNLYVTRVPSDQAFFVCSAEVGTPGQPVGEPNTQGAAADPCTTEEVLVVLDENPGAGPTPPPGTAVEGAVNVNPGQMLTITDGQVAQYNRTEADAWGLDQEAITLASEDEFYIEANSVNVTSS